MIWNRFVLMQNLLLFFQEAFGETITNAYPCSFERNLHNLYHPIKKEHLSCYQVESSNVFFMIKADYCLSLMAHSVWVPPYSTKLVRWKLGIMIVLLIDLSNLIESSHVTINQKDCVFRWVLVPSYYGTVMHHSNCT